MVMSIQQVVNNARTRLAGLMERAQGSGLAQAVFGVPAKVWLAAAALIFAGLWLEEHDARVRRAAELAQTKQQTAVEVRSLEARAARALEQANQRNAARIAELEKQRRALQARAESLDGQLASLRAQEQARAAEIAALPPAELAARLARQLGPSSVVSGPDELHRDGAQLTLSEQGERQVASALAERDACRSASALQAQQVSNCGERLAAQDAEIREQADSLAQLRRALDAQAQLRAARQKEFDAELRAARGTWHSRLVGALKYVALGAALGAAAVR